MNCMFCPVLNTGKCVTSDVLYDVITLARLYFITLAAHRFDDIVKIFEVLLKGFRNCVLKDFSLVVEILHVLILL